MATLIVVSLAPPAAGQERQSPIDLRRASLSIADLPRLHFRYPAAASLGVVNTGSPDELATIRANVPPNSAPLLLGGAAYELVQFHWHAPSEHLVQGRAFPMEMHLVHQTAGGSLLVVGVFIQEGERHEELDEIFESLPTEVGDTSTVAGFDLRTLLPSSKASVRYRGSLTTPPSPRASGGSSSSSPSSWRVTRSTHSSPSFPRATRASRSRLTAAWCGWISASRAGDGALDGSLQKRACEACAGARLATSRGRA